MLIGTYDNPLRQERFDESYEVRPNGCWEWVRGYASHGYGIFTWQYKPERKQISAHVASFLLHHGELPDGHEVRHTCDNRKCVNPGHLVSGDRSANVCDMLERGGYLGYGKGAKLSYEKAAEIRFFYFDGQMNQYQLAEMYNVHQTTIGDIVRGVTWKPRG